jgi:indole-3-glycerol phosphate synthase
MNTQTFDPSALLERTTLTGTILDRITAKKAERILSRMEHHSMEELREKAIASPVITRSFAKALRTNSLNIIAEVKKASPSKGIITEDFRPAEQALAYEAAGAAAISVLTEQDFFLGSDFHLTDIVNQVSLPVLRKDFTIDYSQIYEARIMGASAILLIAALLPDDVLASFRELAGELGLSVLCEVHTMDELMRALDIGADIIGINNRDLKTFHVDLSVTERLAPMIPQGRTIVSESGIHTPADLSRCYRSGAHAVLIGESLMRGAVHTDEGLSVDAKVKELLSGIPGQP